MNKVKKKNMFDGKLKWYAPYKNRKRIWIPYFMVKKFNSITVAAFTKIITAFMSSHYFITNSLQHTLHCPPLPPGGGAQAWWRLLIKCCYTRVEPVCDIQDTMVGDPSQALVAEPWSSTTPTTEPPVGRGFGPGPTTFNPQNKSS